jgi:ABC-type nitrate/sulfonate/bicarbonate transport system substrate-binding protein
MQKKKIGFALTAIIASTLLVGSSAVPAQAAVKNIKVGVIAINSMGAVQYAQDAGIFKKNQINVSDFTTFPAPPPGLAALNSGAVQFMYSPTIPLINSVFNGGLKLKIVAAADGYLKSDVVEGLSDKEYAAKLDDTGACIAKGGSVKAWKDLEGKTVSVPARGAQGEVTIAFAVKKDGGDPSKINWVVLGFPEVQSAVASGKIEAGFVVEPFTSACKTAEAALPAPGVSFFTEGGAIGVWVTTEKYAKANPAVVKAFQKSIYLAGKAGMAPATLNAVVRSSMKITKQTFVVSKSANPTYYPPTVRLIEVQSVADKMFTLGFLKKKVSVKIVMP